MLHMLHWLYTYVNSVCFKCFSCSIRMLQAFYLDVVYVVVAIHMLQMYVIVFLFRTYVAANTLCCKVLYDPRDVGADGGGPLVRAGSEVGTMAPHMHAQAHTYLAPLMGDHSPDLKTANNIPTSYNFFF